MNAPENLLPGTVLPFALEQPDEAIDELLGKLSNRIELLGFGEALHGGQDILLLRNRLFQRLAEKHGFCAIAVESSFLRGDLVNRYVTGRGPDAFADVQNDGFSHGYGAVKANRELVEWMRGYNAQAAVPLQFYGCDMPAGTTGPSSPRQALRLLMDVLGTGSEQRDRVEMRLCHDESWEDPAPWSDPEQSAALVPAARLVQTEVEALLSELRTRQPEFYPDVYMRALHHGVLARELLNFFYALAGPAGTSASLAVRAVMIADNLRYIVECERLRGKVLTFAHNAHLQRGKVALSIAGEPCAWWPAGAHLGRALGPGYAVIGTAIGTSRGNGVAPPEPGTLEARLTALPGPARFVFSADFSAAPAPPRAGSAKNPSYTPLTEQSLRDFDWLAVLDSTSYAAGAYTP